MKKWITTLTAMTMSLLAIAQNNERTLQRKILDNAEMDQVCEMARKTISSGLNAGSSYGEVWIRDFNTFITTAMEVMPDQKIQDALNTFFHFQGEDGNIVDGYIPRRQVMVGTGGYTYRFSPTCHQFAAHKNTVETDQESSLVQAVYQYVEKSGNHAYLQTKINGKTVLERLEMAMEYLMTQKLDEKYGLITGATTADWGDVQPEHHWGVYLTEDSHYCIDIYDNAMFVLAIEDFIKMSQDSEQQQIWASRRDQIKTQVREHLWDEERQKFIPHLYLNGSPFPSNFDENQIYYHGGTAVAACAGLLTREEVGQANERMLANVRKAHAQTIGLTMYPTYPGGFFQNQGMYPYGYQNGGDWTWFGARMIWALVENGYIQEAYDELSPMLKRVIRNKGFYEWYTPAGEPMGSGTFRGEAGVLVTAIEKLKEWAQQTDAVPMEKIENTTVLFIIGQSNAANWGDGQYTSQTPVYNYYDGHLYKAADPMIGADGIKAGPWARLGDLMNQSGFSNGVTLINSAIGGTRIHRWTPGGDCNKIMVKNIERALKDGIHIDYILWHQGESDRMAGTDKESYMRDFLKIREEFRSRGIDAPILVARATYCPVQLLMSQGKPIPKSEKDCVSKELRAAQKELVKKYDDLFAGPDTDKLDKLSERDRRDKLHFSAEGLDKHAALWLKALQKVK